MLLLLDIYIQVYEQISDILYSKVDISENDINEHVENIDKLSNKYINVRTKSRLDQHSEVYSC